MRFVEAKTEEQQARAIVFRAREQLINQRTELVNALRAHLYEFGQIAPQGIRYLSRLEEIVEDAKSNVPALVREICRDLLGQISQLTRRVEALSRKIDALSDRAETSRRLRTMPGVGAITALAIETFAPPMATFKCGRDFAAWLGLVPRQSSTGGKQRLGKVSKMGQQDIRRLLIIGAMAVIRWASRKGAPRGSWLARMMAKKPHMLVAVALANKMARGIFLLGIVHDRRLMCEAQVNIAIRWFAGYGLHEVLPDHSSLTRIRQCWGEERFRRTFQRTVQACIDAKIVKGEIVHVDASLIRADVSWDSLAVRHTEAVSTANEESEARKSRKTGKFKKVCVTDPDATMATNARNRRLEPAYKQHTVVDDLRGVVLDVAVTTGVERQK